MPKRPTVPKKWVRGPVDLLAIEQGCWFDEAAGEFVIDFIEEFCRQSKGRWKGKPLTLLDWQRDFLMRLFGWKRPDGLRRYRTFYLEVAKKNGKSTMLSALAIVMLLADGEGSPEVYLNACDKSQAAIIFEEARRMVAASPDLSGRLDVLNSPNCMRLVDPAGNGVVIVNSSVADSKDGLNPSLTLFDELHRQPDRRLWSVFRYAGASREQPILGAITTAGDDELGVWFEQREHSEKVNRGDVPDVAHLGVVYRALPGDDVDDPATWRKANPSLGHTIKPDDFRADLENARLNPLDWHDFLRLRLNIIASAEAKYFDPDRWRACGPAVAARLDPDRFRAAPCFVGADLSSKIDLTAVVAAFGDFDRGFDVTSWFYLPRDGIEAAERRDRQQYRVLASLGWLTLTDGEVIDYGFLRKEVNRLAKMPRFRLLAIDPHSAELLNQQFLEDGINVANLRQGFISLSEPTKELQALILAGKIRHDGNPLLTWCMGNAVAEVDAAGNNKLSKKKSRLKIDGAAALVNAIAAAQQGGDDPASVYQTRGLLYL